MNIEEKSTKSSCILHFIVSLFGVLKSALMVLIDLARPNIFKKNTPRILINLIIKT